MKKLISSLFAITIILLLGSIPNISYTSNSDSPDISTILTYIKSKEFMDHVIEHVKFLSSLNSRVTGQSGCYVAAKYIASKFREYGLKPGGDNGYFELFTVTVPIDHEVKIVIPESNITIKGYALWPNGIQSCPTPPEGIEGILVYFESGTLKEISEKLHKLNTNDLSNVIALMKFNTYKNWLNLVNFKVKAIIFLEPRETNRIEAETKFTLTPLLVPRIYVLRKHLRVLFDNIYKKVKVFSDMRYKNVKSANIIGIVEGTKYKNDIIVISSYYDSWSVIPRLSPGADEACGVAVLLELARFFSINKPLRTLWFVAFSGHWQALRGSRYFVEKHYFAPEVQNDTVKIWIHFNLDFSTGSNTVTWIHYGSMWIQDKVAGLFDSLFTFIKGTVYSLLMKQGFNVSEYVDDPSMPRMLGYFIHDAEPSVIAGIAGFSFRTSRDMRLSWGTPFNTIDKVMFSNLVPQASFAATCIYMVSNIDNLLLKWGIDYVKPARRYMRSGGGYPGRKGYAGIYGDVVRFDPKIRWYTSKGLENYDVILDVVISPSRYNPFAHTIVKLEGNLTFKIEGIGTDYIFPESGHGAHYVGAGELGVPAVRVYAYAINKTTGRIEWAPDMGVWAWPQNRGFATDREDGWKDVRISLFKCEQAIITNVVDISNLEEPWVSINWRLSTFDRFARACDTPTMYTPTMSFEVMDFKTHSSLLQWGILTPQETGEPFVLIFLPVNSSFEVILRSDSNIVGVLINASDAYKEGTGFRINKGEDLYISLPIQVANDLFWLNKKRFRILANYKAYSMWALEAYRKSHSYYELMKRAESERDYASALGLALLTWSWSNKAYQELVNLINGITYTFIFFSSLLIPFAFLMERLLIESEGFKRLLWLIILYAVPFMFLSLFHPGFEIALSTPLAVIAFVQVVMSIITLLLLSGITGGYFKEFRAKVRGLHFAEISRTGAALLAISLGIQQMKRRKLRTALTLTTVSIIAFTLVLLTSATGSIIAKSAITFKKASYDGILVESNLGVDYLGSKTIDLIIPLLKNSSFTIIRRAWVYPPPFSNIGAEARQFWELRANNGSVQIYAILGLEYSEIYATRIDKVIEWGSFFSKSDMYSCIISKSIADKLGLECGSEVYISGIRLTVIGIVNDDMFNMIRDLDGAVISPIDFASARIALAGSPITPDVIKLMSLEYRTAPNYLLIVPYSLARKVFGAPIYSVIIKAPREKLVFIAEELPLIQYVLTCFLGDTSRDETKLYSASLFIMSRGWESVIFPVSIAAFMVLNLMLGALYERVRELSILGAIGLSPIHLASLLLIEGLLYGVVGTVLGYIPGIIGCRILLSLGMIPEGFVPGFASVYILIVTGIVAAMLLAATVYPALKASKIVTPSVIRRFKLTALTAKMSRNTLEISMPFFATEDEVYAVMGYLSEYFDSCQVEGVGPFITIGPSKIMSEVSGFTKRVILESNVKLPPYDANVMQVARIIASSEIGVNRYSLILLSELLSGSPEIWKNSIGNFVKEVRRQLLLWRTLSDEERVRYLEIGKSIKEKLIGEKQ